MDTQSPPHATRAPDEDLAFLAAWEDGVLPRSIDAATILRVRQIRRAKQAVTFLD